MNKLIVAAACLAALGSAQAQSATYAIDPTHTFTTFEIGHMGTSTIRGRFDRKEGTVTVDRSAKTGRAEITIDTSSISTGVEPFNKHLQSKDFFDAATYPTAKFVGDKFVFDGDKLAAVDGTLTLLGKALPFTLKALHFNCYMHPMLKREVCGGDFEGSLQRSRWGMGWGLDLGAPDSVRLLVQVEAVKQ